MVAFQPPSSLGFSGGAGGKEPPCQCRRCKRLRFDPRVGKIPWRRAWQPTSAFLPGESHGQRSLEGYSPFSLKELDATERLSTHAHPSSLRNEIVKIKNPSGEINLPNNKTFFFSKYLFVWLKWVLVAACGIYYPDQVLNPGPLLWEQRVSGHWTTREAPPNILKWEHF